MHLLRDERGDRVKPILTARVGRKSLAETAKHLPAVGDSIALCGAGHVLHLPRWCRPPSGAARATMPVFGSEFHGFPCEFKAERASAQKSGITLQLNRQYSPYRAFFQRRAHMVGCFVALAGARVTSDLGL